MSKSKYVEHRGSGLWAYDVSLGVLLKHLVDEAQSRLQTTQEEWLREAASDWLRVASIPDIRLSLDASWSPAQLSVVVDLLDAACTTIGTHGLYSAAEVAGWPLQEDLHIFPRGGDDVESAPVVELGHAIISLLAGSHAEPPAGSKWFYGFPEGRQLYPPPKP